MAQKAIQISVGDKTFSCALEENETAQAFVNTLPKTLRMQDLNQNEKFTYGVFLPAREEPIQIIHEGDLMLFEKDCLVLFYRSFHTNFFYTRIGHIADPAGLEKAAGRGSASVTFKVQ